MGLELSPAVQWLEEQALLTRWYRDPAYRRITQRRGGYHHSVIEDYDLHDDEDCRTCTAGAFPSDAHKCRWGETKVAWAGYGHVWKVDPDTDETHVLLNCECGFC